MRSHLSKAAVTLSLMFATWMIVTTIVHRRAAAGNAAAVKSTPSMVAVPIGTQVNRDPANPGIFASHSITEQKISADGDTVSVSASMKMYDGIGGSGRFMWRLDAYDNPLGLRSPKGLTRVFDRMYEDQVFGTPKGHVVSPSFQDTIQLQPGRYLVTLSLYQFPAGFDHTTIIADDELARAYQAVRFGEPVTIDPQ